MVLDLTSQSTDVQLPVEINGKVGTVTLTAWYMNPNNIPYFQFKMEPYPTGFDHPSIGYGAGLLPDAVPVPLPSTYSHITQTWGITIRSQRIFRSQFNISLYDNAGAPLTPTRCILWFDIETKNW